MAGSGFRPSRLFRVKQLDAVKKRQPKRSGGQTVEILPALIPFEWKFPVDRHGFLTDSSCLRSLMLHMN